MTIRHKDEAEALELFRRYRDAIDPGSQSNDNSTELITRVEDILDRTNSQTRKRIEKILAELEVSLAENAFQNYAILTEKIRKTKDGFVLGANIAQQETDDLFFPAAATHLSQISGLLKELKDVANKIDEEINLSPEFKKKDIEGLIEESKTVLSSVDELKNMLQSIKDKLPT